MKRRSAKAAKGQAVMAARVARSIGESDCGDHVSIAEPRSLDEIAMVRRATEVLGIEHVARWMQSAIPSLGNQTPYALIKKEAGRSEVERVLLKVEHGVY